MLNALGNYLTSKGLFSGLLDKYSGADAAYSLQRLSKSTTNVIRARRSIDNSESDFSASDIGDPLRQFAMNDSSELLGYAKSGNRMYFDGSNDDVEFAGFDLRGAVFRMTFLYVSGESQILQMNDNANSGNLIAITLNSISNLTVRLATVANVQLESYIFNSLTENTLCDLIVTISSDGNSIDDATINGVSGSSSAQTGRTQGTATANQMHLGRREDGNFPYTGLIFDVSVDGLHQWNGYGNTNSDWEDQIGSNDGTVNGSPALFTGQGFDAYVATWYDQSGNGQHATQTTASQQPIIIDNGLVITDSNGYATIEFDGSGDHFQMPFSAGSNSGYFITTLADPSDNTTNQWLVDFADAGGDGIQLYGTSLGSIYARTNSVTASQNYDSDPQLFTGEYTGTDLTAYVDGVGGTSLSGSDTNATANGRIGSPAYAVSSTWNGKISEAIIYLSDESSNRSNIESNIAGRYGITLA